MKKTTTKVELMEFTNLQVVLPRRIIRQSWELRGGRIDAPFPRPLAEGRGGYGLLMKNSDNEDEARNRAAARCLIGKLRDEVDARFDHDGDLTLVVPPQFNLPDIWALGSGIRKDMNFAIVSKVEFGQLFGNDDFYEFAPNCAWAGLIQTHREKVVNRPNHQLELIKFISARQSIEDRSKLRRGLTHRPDIDHWEFFDISDKIRCSRCINPDNERYSQFKLSIHHTGEELTRGDVIDLMDDARGTATHLCCHYRQKEVLLTTGGDPSDIWYMGYPDWFTTCVRSVRKIDWDHVPFAEGSIKESYPMLSKEAFEALFLGYTRKEIDERVIYYTIPSPLNYGSAE